MKNDQARAASSKFDAPEFLLFLVVTFMLWCIGFVDLLAHPAADPRYAILGPYSTGVVALMGGYSILFLIWMGLAVIPRSHLRTSQLLAYVQERSWLALGTFGAVVAGVWHILTSPNWLQFPGLSTTLVLFLLIAGAILLFTRWRRHGRVQVWRKIVVALLVAVAGVELIVQSLAFLGMMPGRQHLDAGYIPQGRIYHNWEGLGNGIANNYGWYYPDFRLEPDSQRIALIGDTFIQALQINPEQHLGKWLEDDINQTSHQDGESEVLALGHPGYGSGLYLDLEMLDFAHQAFAPDEIIVVMHLGNDLRNLTKPSNLDVYFSLTKDGAVEIHQDNFDRWHDVAHYVLMGYEPMNPLRVLKSHYLTPILWRSLVGTLSGRQQTAQAAANAVDPVAANPFDIPGVRGVISRTGATSNGHTLVDAMDLVETPGWSNFLFEKAVNEDADEAYQITKLLLRRFHDRTSELGITVRLVTIPVFPEAFYEQFGAESWTPEIGSYDLFRPEKMLRELTQEEGIPLLAMGQYMLDAGLTAADIQRLYYADGTGHLTPEGHVYFANAIYTCFYADAQNEAFASAGCLQERVERQTDAQ